MDWSYAIGKGIQAGAQAGSDAIDQQMKADAAVAAEQKAADIRLNTETRMMAIKQAMSKRAAERFSGVVRSKMAGQPLEIAPGDPAPMTNEGMTVKPSIDDATQQALDETLQSDPEAYMAGTGMLGAEMKDRRAAAALVMREKIEGDKIASRERTEAAKIEQRDRAEDKRYNAMMARIEASARRAEGGNGKAGSKSAMVQNLEWMRDNLKWTPDQLADYVTEKKRVPVEDIAAKLLSADKFGDMSPEQAMERATQLVKAGEALRAKGDGKPPASAKPAQKALPPGAKQIGTSGGKPVYQTPDGKKFIQE